VTIITLSVSKVFKNSGSLRFHRKKTKPAWKHYYLNDETGEWKFKSEWVHSIKAQILKHKVYKKRRFFCLECKSIFEGFVKKDSSKCECPNCLE